MAYANSTTDRMDELRFRRNDASLRGLVSPPRNGSRLPQPLPSQDGRGGMVRRFTTDSGRVPTIASLTTLRSGQESMDFGPSVRAELTVGNPHSQLFMLLPLSPLNFLDPLPLSIFPSI